jgi:hypothetical protein
MYLIPQGLKLPFALLQVPYPAFSGVMNQVCWIIKPLPRQDGLRYALRSRACNAKGWTETMSCYRPALLHRR